MTAGLAAHARRALHHGLCVLPAAADGTKRPAIAWRVYQHQLPQATDIEAWFATSHHDGLGYICGAVSGNLEMLELEARAVHDGIYEQIIDTAAGCGLDFVRAIDAGYTERSPTGGIHWLYRVTRPVDGNLKLARRPGSIDNTVDVLIETRGEGGWTVAAPSDGRTHPTGRPWRIIHGDIATIHTISPEQRQQLHDLCRTFDRTPTSNPAQPDLRKPAKNNGDRPGDIYNRTTTWAEILQPAGWTLIYIRGDISYWRRPGKTHGISATTNANGTDRLCVHSTSTIFASSPESYDKLGAQALLHHHGDITATIRAIAPPQPERPVNQLVAASPTGQHQDEPDNDLLKPIHWPTFWRQDHSDQQWLLQPFLVRGRSHALYAPAKTGKSLLVLETVVALATGRPYMYETDIAPTHVMYLDYEMTENDLYQRLDAMGHDERTNLDHLHYFLVAGLPGLDTQEGGQEIVRLARHHTAQLVIIDTTARAVDGEENESKTIIDLYRHTGITLKRDGITMLRVDHAGKNLDKGQRGTSAKNDDVDIVWQLTGAGDRYILKCTHQRVGYVPSQIELQRSQEPLSYKITTYQWPAGTKELADRLDQLNLPVDVGRDKCRAAVKAWNEDHPEDQTPTQNSVLTAAIKWRKTGQSQNRPVSELTEDRFSGQVP